MTKERSPIEAPSALLHRLIYGEVRSECPNRRTQSKIPMHRDSSRTLPFNSNLHGLRGIAAMAGLLFHWGSKLGHFREARSTLIVTWLDTRWDLAMLLDLGFLSESLFFCPAQPGDPERPTNAGRRIRRTPAADSGDAGPRRDRLLRRRTADHGTPMEWIMKTGVIYCREIAAIDSARASAIFACPAIFGCTSSPTKSSGVSRRKRSGPQTTLSNCAHNRSISDP